MERLLLLLFLGGAQTMRIFLFYFLMAGRLCVCCPDRLNGRLILSLLRQFL
ncbi:unnamed protein product [Meloidogyne enterolobii]|uniref:Uncharacterized protein n=1 Tax=Meloidogyne enterolobii TaxID=390850 RepID=A0ACB1B009_MELEN